MNTQTDKMRTVEMRKTKVEKGRYKSRQSFLEGV